MPRLTRLQPHKLSQDCSLGGIARAAVLLGPFPVLRTVV